MKAYVAPGRSGPPYAVRDVDRLKALIAEGFNDRQCAVAFACSVRTIRNTRKRYGIPAARPRKRKAEEA